MTLPHMLAFVALILWTGGELAQMTFTPVASGASSQIEELRTAIVRTPAEWSKLWTEHAAQDKPPAVDFATSSVVAVFLGTRPSAGYTVEITRIEKKGDGLVVSYRERPPGADAMVAQMLTSPFVVVRTEPHAGAVTFTRER